MSQQLYFLLSLNYLNKAYKQLKFLDIDVNFSNFVLILGKEIRIRLFVTLIKMWGRKKNALPLTHSIKRNNFPKNPPSF